MLRFARRFAYSFQLVFSAALGLIIVMGSLLSHLSSEGANGINRAEDTGSLLAIGFASITVFPLLFIYPWVLLGYQLLLFVRAVRWRTVQHHRPWYDTWVLAFLTACQMLYLGVAKEVVFRLDGKRS